VASGVVALGDGPLLGVMSLDELLLGAWLLYCCILAVQVALTVASERPSFLAFSFATQFCIHESLLIDSVVVWASAVALAAARPSASAIEIGLITLRLLVLGAAMRDWGGPAARGDCPAAQGADI
jgi:hypothetical protein